MIHGIMGNCAGICNLFVMGLWLICDLFVGSVCNLWAYRTSVYGQALETCNFHMEILQFPQQLTLRSLVNCLKCCSTASPTINFTYDPDREFVHYGYDSGMSR